MTAAELLLHVEHTANNTPVMLEALAGIIVSAFALAVVVAWWWSL